MKKLILAVSLLLLIALGFTACRSSKPPCPAYPSTQAVEHIDLNIAR